MVKIIYDELCRDALKNKGIQAFEKYIGRIEWLHTKNVDDLEVKSSKKYAVIDAIKHAIVYEADKIADIAKEFDTSKSNVSKCYTSRDLIHERYAVVRCENE